MDPTDLSHFLSDSETEPYGDTNGDADDLGSRPSAQSSAADTEERTARRYWSWYTLYGKNEHANDYAGIGVFWGRHWLWGDNHGVAYLHRHPSIELGWYRWRTAWFEDGPIYTHIGANNNIVYVHYDGAELMEIMPNTYELQGDEMWFDDLLNGDDRSFVSADFQVQEQEEESVAESSENDDFNLVLEIRNRLRREGVCKHLWWAMYHALPLNTTVFVFRGLGDMDLKDCLIQCIQQQGAFGEMPSPWHHLGLQNGGTVDGVHYTERQCYLLVVGHHPHYSASWYMLYKMGGCQEELGS